MNAPVANECETKVCCCERDNGMQRQTGDGAEPRTKEREREKKE